MDWTFCGQEARYENYIHRPSKVRADHEPLALPPAKRLTIWFSFKRKRNIC